MRVTARDVKQLLERFEGCLRKLLTDESLQSLREAAAQLKGDADNVPPSPDENQKLPWGYTIYAARPIRFTGCLPEKGCEIDVEIFCHVRGTGTAGGDQVAEQNVVIRVMAAGPKLFSSEQQASRVCDYPWQDDPATKHIIARFHIDRPGDELVGEPTYHIQVGGKVKDGEVGIRWPPDKLDVPRFPCLPLDLVLTCELVLANFLPDKYEKLRKDPEWKGLVRKAEGFFVKPHLSALHQHLNDPNRAESLLELVCRMNQGG